MALIILRRPLLPDSVIVGNVVLLLLFLLNEPSLKDLESVRDNGRNLLIPDIEALGDEEVEDGDF